MSQYDDVVDDVRQSLSGRIDAAGPLVWLEKDAVLAEFQRIALALVLAVGNEPASSGLVPNDVAESWVGEYVRGQLEKDASVLLSNAEARAFHAQHVARDMWRTRIDTARRYKR